MEFLTQVAVELTVLTICYLVKQVAKLHRNSPYFLERQIDILGDFWHPLLMSVTFTYLSLILYSAFLA